MNNSSPQPPAATSELVDVVQDAATDTAAAVAHLSHAADWLHAQAHAEESRGHLAQAAQFAMLASAVARVHTQTSVVYARLNTMIAAPDHGGVARRMRVALPAILRESWAGAAPFAMPETGVAVVLLLLIGQGWLSIASAASMSLVPAIVVQLGALVLAGHGAWHFRAAQASHGTNAARDLPLVAVIGLVLLAAVLRFAWLDSFPFRIDGDAAAFALAAHDFFGTDPPPLIGTGWMGHTNMYFFFESLVLRVFGSTVLGMRVFSALGGVLGVVCTCLAGRWLFGARVGVLAGLCAAVLPFDLVFSRTGTEVIHLTWLVPLAFGSIWLGWQRTAAQAKMVWLCAGAVIGLSQYFYPGARLIPFLALAQIGLLTWFPPDGGRAWRRGGTALLWLLLGGILAYGPMLPYYISHPDTYTVRMNTVSIFAAGWLADELAQRPWWNVLGTQVGRAFFPFLFPVDGARLWYVWPQYLGPFDAALFGLGLLCLCLSRDVARWLKLFIGCYLALGFVLAGVLTTETPMPSRYVVFVPAVAWCIGLGLDQALACGQALLNRRMLLLFNVGALLGLCLYGVFNVRSYQQHDIDANKYYNQTATFAIRYLAGMGNASYGVVYLRTDNSYYRSDPALAFVAQQSGVDVPQDRRCGALDPIPPGDETVIIAPAERIGEVAMLHNMFPDGSYQVFSNPQGRPLVGVMRVVRPPNLMVELLCNGN